MVSSSTSRTSVAGTACVTIANDEIGAVPRLGEESVAKAMGRVARYFTIMPILSFRTSTTISQ